jgi:hypothetical protein
MVMLIDTRDERRDPEPEPRRRGPEPRLAALKPFAPFGWAVAMLVAVDWVPPLPGYVFIVSACWLICRGLSRILSDGDGLREHRQ